LGTITYKLNPRSSTLIVIKTVHLSKLLTYLLLLLIFVLTASCQNSKTKSFANISRLNIKQIDEVFTIQGEYQTSISALVIQPGNEHIRFVQSDEVTSVQTWNILSQEKVNQIDFDNLIGATLNPNGLQLASYLNNPSKIAITSDPGYGFQVIDTETGEITFSQSANALSLALSNNGEWILVGEAGGYGLWNVVQQKPVLSVVSGGLSEHNGVTAVAFNKDNSRAAFALSGDRTEFYTLDLEINKKPVGTHFLQGPNDNAIAIQFSPDNQWLARLADVSLTFFHISEIERLMFESEEAQELLAIEDIKERWDAMLEIQKSVEEQTFTHTRTSIGSGTLAFNPNGDLLAIGTDNGWEIWDVDNQEMILEHETEGVYALTFSPDGRWFAWGDMNGLIHIWAVVP